ncbi:hypothetical protein Q0590_36695 [Rhodocytophaga aerolata]|uniref:Uncharacterized protein n=1 Tax=Rhodocytophaga aerolata TaxID=455078 RepID=A0ABT8RID2_9BACT|nr:hypothetical protein [Rhodocytophaga aerolata]MDO1451866.1 hypothetical protein [Rhodocytophaga aerolata]
MRRILNLYIIFLLLTSCKEDEKGHYLTDKDFVLISDSTSPDKKFIIVEYQFDHGGHGYSRLFWAITPLDYKTLDLSDYKLPDGYKAKGWNEDNSVLIEKWEPYYYKQESVNLKSGDVYKGISIRIINDKE